jgi:hypothetical protein
MHLLFVTSFISIFYITGKNYLYNGNRFLLWFGIVKASMCSGCLNVLELIVGS